jgi:hypothetical protein
MYVLPSDGTDRALDTNGTLEASTANWETWLRGQTGGPGLRLDTYQGSLDITFYRAAETDAQLAANGAFVRDAIERELRAAGLIQPHKLYAVYYDGTNTTACGSGGWPPSLAGAVGAVYIPSTFWNTVGDPCYDPSASLAGLALMDLAMLHEMLHLMGFVPTCATHSTGNGHVSDSPTDLMYAGPDNWYPSVLDVGHDDYFDAHIPGCPDFSNSPYLEGNDPFALTTSVISTGGQGTISSDPIGIDCPASCTTTFDQPTSVTFTAHPALGSRFAGWSGACTNTDLSCTITIDAAKSISASFAIQQTPPGPLLPARTTMQLHSATSGPRVVTRGQQLALTIRWKNGRAIATSVVVCATLPTRLVLVKARGARARERQACWNTLSVSPGTTLSFAIVARVRARARAGSASIVTTASAANAAAIRTVTLVHIRIRHPAT